MYVCMYVDYWEVYLHLVDFHMPLTLLFELFQCLGPIPTLLGRNPFECFQNTRHHTFETCRRARDE